MAVWVLLIIHALIEVDFDSQRTERDKDYSGPTISESIESMNVKEKTFVYSPSSGTKGVVVLFNEHRAPAI